LASNVRTWLWTEKQKLTGANGFKPTEGLRVRGETGWHTHGSGDKKDVDVDAAIILEADATINPNWTTIVLWSLPITGQNLTTSSLYEVGMLEYKRGTLSDVEKWSLTQGISTNYKSGDQWFNPNGLQWSDIFTVWPDSYVKKGATQDTSYWSENVLARVTQDKKVVLAMARPALSNTIVFKAGAKVNAEFGLIQYSSQTSKAIGWGSATWTLSEMSMNGALSLLSQTSSAVLLLSALNQLI